MMPQKTLVESLDSLIEKVHDLQAELLLFDFNYPEFSQKYGWTQYAVSILKPSTGWSDIVRQYKSLKEEAK